MLDIKYIRENFKEVQKRLKLRDASIDISPVTKLDATRRELLQKVEALKQKRNEVSKEIARLKKEKADASELVAEMQGVSTEIKELDKSVSETEEGLKGFLLSIPNLLHESVPHGTDESDNRIERVVNEKPSFGFAPKAHNEIGETLGIIDFERAAKIAGARFAILKGPGALLERALINFMLDMHTTRHEYTEVLPPFMVNKDCYIGTGQLPKFEDDLFKIEGWEHYLVPTAEVPLTNIHAGEILKAGDLPILYTAYTPCFRKEAGSYGKDVKGLIRQHQFNKVELVRLCVPEDSYKELETLTLDAEKVLAELGLAYRAVTLCSGDTGFSAAKTFDIEVWLPGQNAYREISSCSNFEDFQARRANIRYKPDEDGAKPKFVHTINGSGLAVGRTLVAIIENFQQEDGSVTVPEALQPYMGGLEKIGPV
ncbi:MAG: serine--tRNA ligase [Thermodesulfobacteriota bacterium]